jgi:hypothetical protein
VRICVRCAEIVFGASTSCCAICRLVRPAATSWATSYSRSLSGCHGSADRPGSDDRVSRSASSRRVMAPAAAAMVRVSSRSRAASPPAPGFGGGRREVEQGPRALPEPAPGPPRLPRRFQRLVRCGRIAAGEQDEPPARGRSRGASRG